MQNAMISEFTRPLIGLAPKDITGAAQTGAWVNMKFASKLAIWLIQGAWAGGTPAVTLSQASDSSGTGAKTLAFDQYWSLDQDSSEKLAVTAVSSNTFNLTASANIITLINVRATDLDLVNGFCYVRVNVASPGSNADLLAILYQLYNLDYEGKPGNLPAALTG